MRILSTASCGTDEAEKRKAAREAAEGKRARISFAAWRAEYLKDVGRGRLRSTSEITRYLELAGEAWDAKPLEEISVRDAEELRNKIAMRGAASANAKDEAVADGVGEDSARLPAAILPASKRDVFLICIRSKSMLLCAG